MTKEKKLVEYPDAPSGSVYFYNYKEPLMPYVGGYGYVGALIHDQGSDELQCHLCGVWKAHLPQHLRREHNTSAAEYRNEVGLNVRTALVSEKIRAVLIENGVRNYKNLSSKAKRGSKKGRPAPKTTSERKNNTNTCPEQLLERLRQLIAKLGRTPTMEEITFRPTLVNVYGSVKNALEIIGAQPRVVGVQARRIVYTRAELILLIKNFEKKHNRKPSYSDCKRKLLPAVERFRKEFGTWKKAVAAAQV